LGFAGKIIWTTRAPGRENPSHGSKASAPGPPDLAPGDFALTIALLDSGRWQLRRSIDKVAEYFGSKTLTAQEAEPFPTIRGWKAKFRWLWCLETKDAGTSEGTQAPVGDRPLDRVSRLTRASVPSTTRIVVTSAIFFAFSLALMSLAWPHSPHRGEWRHGSTRSAAVTARWNDGSALRALDATGMATRLLARLDPSVAMPRRVKPEEEELRRRYPVGKDASRRGSISGSRCEWPRSELVIYLPFLRFF